MLLPRLFVKSLKTALKVCPLLTLSLQIAATSNIIFDKHNYHKGNTAANGLVPFVTFFIGQGNCVTNQTTAAEGTNLS